MDAMHMPDNLAKAEAIFSDAVDLAQDRNAPIDSKIAWGLLVLCRALSSEMDDIRGQLDEIRKQTTNR